MLEQSDFFSGFFSGIAVTLVAAIVFCKYIEWSGNWHWILNNRKRNEGVWYCERS